MVREPPFFSILLPAKGRPDLVHDALQSILLQSFGNFEVIVSNNGADPLVKEALLPGLDDPRVTYVEQPSVLAMPWHWEKILQLARGRYITVLTDRSVLTSHALDRIHHLHCEGKEDAEIVTWSWDLYFDDSHLLLPYAGNTDTPLRLESDALALASMTTEARYPTALPRGLNSSVSRKVVDNLRDRFGMVFRPINPDFSFAYACLMCSERITHLDKALMISQGLGVSNGGNAYRTDAVNYVSTLGLENPLQFSPIKALFVENIIAEDFFAACHDAGRKDLLNKLDMANLYLKCLAELDEKLNANELPVQRLQELQEALDSALLAESADVQARVSEGRSKSGKTHSRLRQYCKKSLRPFMKYIQPALLRLQGASHHSSVLKAAGFPD